ELRELDRRARMQADLIGQQRAGLEDLGGDRDHGCKNSSAVRRTCSRDAPPEASVAAITAPSTIGASQTTTRLRRSSSSRSTAISALVSAPPRSTRIATPRADQARSIAWRID